MWTPHKSHAIDEHICNLVQRRWPDHTIVVKNKWGIGVCGSIPRIPIGRVVVEERGERNWVYEIQEAAA